MRIAEATSHKQVVHADGQLVLGDQLAELTAGAAGVVQVKAQRDSLLVVIIDGTGGDEVSIFARRQPRTSLVVVGLERVGVAYSQVLDDA